MQGRKLLSKKYEGFTCTIMGNKLAMKMRDANRIWGGKVVCISGAGSGIGKALALEFASRNAVLELSDVNESGLNEVKIEIQSTYGTSVTIQQVDVSEYYQVKDWVDQVKDRNGGVHLLINNAGVSLSAAFSESTKENIEWVIRTNLFSVLYCCKLFLPLLNKFSSKSSRAQIVNLSSLFGMIGVPNQSIYCASKFAVRGLSESLSMEYELTGEGPHVSVVMPGGVDTGLIKNGRSGNRVGDNRTDIEFEKDFKEKNAAITSGEAAEIIVKGIERRRIRIVVGRDALFFDLAHRIFPCGYRKILLKLIRSAKFFTNTSKESV